MQELLPANAVEDANERFERAAPPEVVRWALEESGLDRVAVASAFQAEGTCVMHMATRIRPDLPILFLETGFHFRETLRFGHAQILPRRPAPRPCPGAQGQRGGSPTRPPDVPP